MLDSKEYVVATFEPCDVRASLREEHPELLEYLDANGLTDPLILSVVKKLRDWYDETSGDAVQEFLEDALRWLVGDEVLEAMGYEA